MSIVDAVILGMQAGCSPSSYWAPGVAKFTELEASHLIMQRNNQSVREHTMSVIDLLTIKNPITLLSGLFHDLGKCRTQSTSLRFKDHAIASANIARTRLTEWEASPYLIDRVTRIVLTHMYDIKGYYNEKTIRNFIAKVGQDNIENWFAVRIADSASYSNHNQYKRHLIDPFYKKVKKYLDELSPEDHSLQLRSEPNTIIGGKECKNGDMFLSTEGS